MSATTADPLAMAVRLLRQVEGCRLAPYQDSGGCWTIGIGSITIDGAPVTADTPPILPSKADALLMAELANKVGGVHACVTVPLAPYQWAALYSFAYNEGVGALRSSTLLRKLNAGDVAGAAAQFPAWVYCKGAVVKGLQNRRALEQAVFLGKVSV